MAYYFSKLVDKYFLQWIQPFTWDSGHSNDLVRYFQFLKAWQRYSRKQNQALIYGKIIKAAKQFHPNASDGHIQEQARYFSDLARTIAFYNEARFPDELIELNNPHSVWLRLWTVQVADGSNMRPMYTADEIEEFIEKHFGEDWREKYSE